MGGKMFNVKANHYLIYGLCSIGLSHVVDAMDNLPKTDEQTSSESSSLRSSTTEVSEGGEQPSSQQASFDVENFLTTQKIEIDEKIYRVTIQKELKEIIRDPSNEKTHEFLEKIQWLKATKIDSDVTYISFEILDDEIYYELCLGENAY